MKQLRVGLIGLGMMGRHHARVLREVDGVQLVAVADAYGDPHGAAGDLTLCKSVDELIAQRIDMAVCAVPTALHEEVGLTLAAAGVHTMVEKPIASTVEGGKKLAEVFEAAELIGAVGHIERFNPALQSLRSRIEDGNLGDVYQITTRRQGPYPARIADVGVVKDLGTHDFDLTAWLAQSPYKSIAARTSTRSERPHEDMLTASCQLSNGVITSHLVNWLSPVKERMIVATGERGAYVADTLSADLMFYENGTANTEWEAISRFRGVSEGNMTRFALTKREPLKAEHEAFRDAVLGKRNDVVSMREGLNTLRVAEAMLESARTGEAAELIS